MRKSINRFSKAFHSDALVSSDGLVVARPARRANGKAGTLLSPLHGRSGRVDTIPIEAAVGDTYSQRKVSATSGQTASGQTRTLQEESSGDLLFSATKSMRRS